MEMTAGRGAWSGPEPLACFKDELWDRRPRDFKWSVWNKFERLHDWKDDAKPEFTRTYDSVIFGGNRTSFTWKNMHAVSTNPVLAADVVNACMEALSDLELQLLRDRNERTIGHLATAHLRTCRKRDKEDPSSPNRATLERTVAKQEAEIRALESCDVRTNTQFKIMKRAEVPTKAGVPSEDRIRECRAYFNSLNVPPF